MSQPSPWQAMLTSAAISRCLSTRLCPKQFTENDATLARARGREEPGVGCRTRGLVAAGSDGGGRRPGHGRKGWRATGQGECALRVLGVDPGIATCGYGVLERHGVAGTLQVVAFGAVRPKGPGDPRRLAALYEAIRALLQRHTPDAAAVERLYHTRNVSTATSVGQARGVVLLALAQAGLEVGEYTPTEVKLAVAGYGGADKAQMQAMVAAQLHLPDPPRPDDAADALGVGLCHLLGEGLRRSLATAGAARGGRNG